MIGPFSCGINRVCCKRLFQGKGCLRVKVEGGLFWQPLDCSVTCYQHYLSKPLDVPDVLVSHISWLIKGCPPKMDNVWSQPSVLHDFYYWPCKPVQNICCFDLSLEHEVGTGRGGKCQNIWLCSTAKKKVHLSSKSTQISTYDMQLFTSQHQYLPTIWGQVKDVRGRRKEIPSLDLLHSYCQG